MQDVARLVKYYCVQYFCPNCGLGVWISKQRLDDQEKWFCSPECREEFTAAGKSVAPGCTPREIEEQRYRLFLDKSCARGLTRSRS